MAQVLAIDKVPRFTVGGQSPLLAPASSIHLSDSGETSAIWLKGGGTVENLGIGVVTPDILAAVKSRSVTAALLGVSLAG